MQTCRMFHMLVVEMLDLFNLEPIHTLIRTKVATRILEQTLTQEATPTPAEVALLLSLDPIRRLRSGVHQPPQGCHHMDPQLLSTMMVDTIRPQ